MPEEKHISENRIVSTPGTYSIFGTKENTKPSEINALPLDAVIGNFRILAVNEHPNSYTIITIIAYPNKLNYIVGDTLDYTGLEITATLPNGTVHDITADCVLLPAEGYEITELGDITVSIIYDSMTLGVFRVAVTGIIAYGEWWALWNNGQLDIYCVGNMPNYSSSYNRYAPWYEYRKSVINVTLSDSVTSIGNDAFYNCTNLTSITIPDSVTGIGSYAFSHANLTSITIPDSVTSIGNNAFAYTRLTSITIPDSVTYIEGYVFNGCAITSAIIPDTFTSIENGMFSGCSNLASIMIPDSVTRIGRYAFSGCRSLTSITIPNGVTSIENNTFMNCSGLTSITIPNGVTSIGNYAFASCSALSDVYYSGTEAQWNAITIGTYNTPLTSATIHYNSTGLT